MARTLAPDGHHGRITHGLGVGAQIPVRHRLGNFQLRMGPTLAQTIYIRRFPITTEKNRMRFDTFGPRLAVPVAQTLVRLASGRARLPLGIGRFPLSPRLVRVRAEVAGVDQLAAQIARVRAHDLVDVFGTDVGVVVVGVFEDEGAKGLQVFRGTFTHRSTSQTTCNGGTVDMFNAVCLTSTPALPVFWR